MCLFRIVIIVIKSFPAWRPIVSRGNGTEGIPRGVSSAAYRFFSVDKLSGSDVDDKSAMAVAAADDLYRGLLQEARDL